MGAQEDLFAAVDKKDAKGVKAALAAGANPNLRDEQGYSPLESAIGLKSKTVAMALLEGGCDVSSRNRKDERLLFASVSAGADLDVIRGIAARDKDLNAQNGAWGRTALHAAILRPKLDIAEALLAAGASIDAPDKDGSSPLQYALDEASATTLAAAEWLIGKGADLNHLDDAGENALSVALRRIKTPAIVASLISRGAKLVTNKYGKTPVHLAVNNPSDNKLVLDLLIARGLDLNAKDESGNTPLHIAAGAHNPHNVKYLLAHGADPTIQNENGLTAAENAKRFAPKVAKVIEDWIAANGPGGTPSTKATATKPAATKPAKKPAARKPAKKPAAKKR